MYIRAMGIDCDTVSTICPLDFGNIPTVWYFSFFMKQTVHIGHERYIQMTANHTNIRKRLHRLWSKNSTNVSYTKIRNLSKSNVISIFCNCIETISQLGMQCYKRHDLLCTYLHNFCLNTRNHRCCCWYCKLQYTII